MYSYQTSDLDQSDGHHGYPCLQIDSIFSHRANQGIIPVAQKHLRQYRAKRDFRKTPEPAPRKKHRAGKAIFVIQKHAASHLHYDFRLEIDGVLVSWAIPKGPSTDPRIKRLAVRTEDHPMEYAKFEGNIPLGQYGGGTVIVWDTGHYDDITTDIEENPSDVVSGLENGHIAVWLHGHKLQGGYALTQTKMRGDPRNWLLVKMKDKMADARRNPTSTQPESVLSGCTVEQVAKKA